MRILLLVFCLFAPLWTQSLNVYTVKDDNQVLRAGCADSDRSLAKLQKGDPVKIRFALSGGNRHCYAVLVKVDGRTEQGYLAAESIDGLEVFEQGRRSAAPIVGPKVGRSQVKAPSRYAAPAAPTMNKTDYALSAEVFRAADALQSGRPAEAESILASTGAPRSHLGAAAVRASALLELNQPDRAMEILQPALKANKQDPQLLALAGLAAHKMDDSRQALEYWRESLDLHPSPALEKMYKKVEQELASDKSTQMSYGARFLLRYDGAVADPELARSMVSVLEEEFTRISFQLGCRAEERIITVIQSREAYEKTTGAAKWTSGLYDGKIRIPVAGNNRIDPQTRQSFAHELVHACMANIGPWPTWLHEGMAQVLSGDKLESRDREALRQAARAGKLPKLDELGQNWSRFSGPRASVAYAQALAVVELFFEKHSQYGARNLMQNPERMSEITADLDRWLRDSLK